MAKLTCQQDIDVPFELCFKYPLKKGYTLESLSQRDVKKFQAFLNKVSKMTVTQVDQAYARKPDPADTFRGMQVYHYKVDETFRIHVVIEKESFKIVRLDPNHKFHHK